MARLWARTTGPWRSTVKPHGLVAAEHSLQRQIADALRLKIAPPGKVSRDCMVWWSVDHAADAGTAPGARIGRGIVAGLPNLFVLHRGIAHMVEIKTRLVNCRIRSSR